MMADDTFLFAIFWMVVGVVSIVAITMISKTIQAKARMADDGAYRALAERAVAALEEQTGTINALRADLTAARTTLTNVEKILKQVE
ncbi:hypothetical protein [Niveispirillum cyanobacteriorum]|uniref:Uncharacterized protein n=1 Tax=Niveispirillum cyanobacteriorum TaxID=1612173 RepID=A0A2K9N9I4_9PROT|nr:hypothetical protein [Niveispirillum cyanobacteriorum]AUN29747.1 hypothetical protein C0V82_05565 [Niveispirillum cyanobacteriorum]